MPTDWQELSLVSAVSPAVVDPRRRLNWCLATFILLLIVVWCRAVQLEIGQGAAFREEALRPIRREKPVPAARGRIMARDGTLLACDREVAAVAVAYRYIEEPPQPDWLEQLARRRLPKDQRRVAARLAEEVQKLRQERDELHRRLAALCGIELPQWQARARKVQSRVQRIAADVRRRQIEAACAAPPRNNASWADRFSAALHALWEPARDALPETVSVAEELADHVLAEDVPAAVAVEIRRHAENYPGTRIVSLRCRTYPAGSLAAHLVVAHETELADGHDVTLTIDPRLQRTAEELLDSAVQRVALQSDRREPSGGAVVVLDVHNGEILAAASAPRFDPAAFASKNSSRREVLLADPAHPLFHRAIQMALPPGSVFKTVTAIALLESAGLDPAATFYCQGYLKHPDRQRCAVYVRHGTGHGDVTLADALAESCNVYFFHHVEKLPPQALVDWARRLGFGRPTGVDLAGEAGGILPSAGHGWRTVDTQAMSIGQGALTATPLQVVRMMAAVANGGLLVAPHVVRGGATSGGHALPPPQPVPGLTFSTLAAIRAGLLAAVAGKEGTAHGSLYLQQIPIAGKTGTAETGEGQSDHAWFAGYVPADRPRYAMVVVLEHSGNAATAACPVAKRLVLRMLETGLLETTP